MFSCEICKFYDHLLYEIPLVAGCEALTFLSHCVNQFSNKVTAMPNPPVKDQLPPPYNKNILKTPLSKPNFLKAHNFLVQLNTETKKSWF